MYGFMGTTKIPANVTNQYDLIRHFLYATHDEPVQFDYHNDTDVAQTGTRFLSIMVKKMSEGAY